MLIPVVFLLVADVEVLVECVRFVAVCVSEADEQAVVLRGGEVVDGVVP